MQMMLSALKLASSVKSDTIYKVVLYGLLILGGAIIY